MTSGGTEKKKKKEGKPTSGFQLLRTTSQEILDFFRRHFSSLPRVGPFWLGRAIIFYHRSFGLFGSMRVLDSKNAGEKRHFHLALLELLR